MSERHSGPVENVGSAPHVVSLLRDHARARPDLPAVIFVRDPVADDSSSVTFAELDRHARRIAALLAERTPEGSRVLLLYPSGVEFVAAFFGCLYAGRIAVPAPVPGNQRHESRRVHGIAEDADVALVCTSDALLPEITDWARRERLSGADVVATDGADTGDADLWTPPDLDRDTLALLQYTSGSTGDPKGAMVTHGNLLHNVAAVHRTMEVPVGTRFGGWAPLFHDMGLMVQTLPSVLTGCAAVLMAPTTFIRQPISWLRLIDRYSVGWSPAPNFAYEMCTTRIRDADLAGLDLSRWRYAAIGAEPVRPATMARFTERFAAVGLRPDAVTPCYGLAESTVFVSGAPVRPARTLWVETAALERGDLRPTDRRDDAVELVSNGVAAEDVRVVDPRTREVLPPGQVGELWLRGPSVVRGYWRRDAATDATFRARTADGDGDFLRTGDLGTVHDGELLVTGRIKELMIVKGRNLYPQDVEYEVREHHPELAGLFGAAFTVPELRAGPVGDDPLVVVHEVRGLPAADPARQLTTAMRLTVAREFGVGPAGVVLVRRGGVPRTTSGKIMRSQLRRLLLDGELTSCYANYEPRFDAVLTAHLSSRTREPDLAGEPR